MIDVDLVIRKLVLIITDLEALRPFAAKDATAYLAAPLDEIDCLPGEHLPTGGSGHRPGRRAQIHPLTPQR